MKFDVQGRELPDPRPVEIPAGMRKPETLQQMMARMVSTQLAANAAAHGMETFEESFDFDIDDDGELPLTGHELVAMKAEIGSNGEGADADSRDGEDGETGKGRGKSGARKRNRDGTREDDESEDDGDTEANERRRASDGNRGVKGRDSRAEDDSRARAGRARGKDVDD